MLHVEDYKPHSLGTNVLSYLTVVAAHSENHCPDHLFSLVFIRVCGFIKIFLNTFY